MDEVYLTTTEALNDVPKRGDIRAGTADTDVYQVSGKEDDWRISYGRETSMSYASREAAFEAAVAAATNAIRDGHDVTIHVAGTQPRDNAPGLA